MFDINICSISTITSEKGLRLDANDVNNSKVVILNDKGKPESDGNEMLGQEINNHLIYTRENAKVFDYDAFLRDYKGLMENGDYERCEKLCLEAIHVNQSSTKFAQSFTIVWCIYMRTGWNKSHLMTFLIDMSWHYSLMTVMPMLISMLPIF
ncbi:hypothetical protein RFI_20370 [Reticulomyxa filosa]|uniref:Uncharacterized protein n=1 Tax=Reticulomyxa filosa TaxID=46433 RepID=X6MU62_RETFI|nr:hypothetical protein RFI_20370 [Reticulomyxa filosa]|eukprot:ETO16967.1 hypothetical protein RFI_20370 [Reticulomyxa filosa]